MKHQKKMIGGIFLKLCIFVIGVWRLPVSAEEWTAHVVRNMNAQVGTCVVVPCSFTHPKERLPTNRLRGQWHRSNDKEQLIYNSDNTRVLESFRGRTRLLGELGKGNCSLEITHIKNHDNGPFCFRIELARTETDTNTPDKYSFVDDCVTLHLQSELKEPSLDHNDPIEGRPFAITCSFLHTCPTSMPLLTWSRGSADQITLHNKEIHQGVWQITSVLTFIPVQKDDRQEVTCTVRHGEKESIARRTLYIKHLENYNHIIIPVVVALVSAAIFGGLCFLMVKKYKRRIEELQSKDSTLFRGLSRMSRRFRRHREIPTDEKPKSCEVFAKPRLPSPKSNPRRCSFPEDDANDYMNAEDLNVYGNL